MQHYTCVADNNQVNQDNQINSAIKLSSDIQLTFYRGTGRKGIFKLKIRYFQILPMFPIFKEKNIRYDY